MTATESPTLEAWCSAWSPEDSRTPGEWGEQYITVPGAARSEKFSLTATPHLRELFEFYGRPHTREMVAVLPTGAGKTTLFDVCIPHSIAEDPASVVLYMQGNKEAEGHMEDRLLPTLRNCEPVSMLMGSLNRHSIRKDGVIFPHLSLYVRGLNKTNTQRISVRDVFIDEAWLADHGLIEQARARTHNRWNRRVIIVSQGGNQHFILGAEKRETELYAAWNRTDKREWSMVCPECGGVSPWKLINLRYAESEDDREVIESAKYHCPNCPAIFDDRPEVRRALATASRYVATNANHMPDHHGWHAQAVGLFHETWGELALGWRKANQAKKNGDVEPLKIFITKRLAEWWSEEEDAPEVVLGSSGYSVGDFAEGGLIDGEVLRFMAIDRQRDYFFAGIRAFRADGTSRLLYYSKVATIEQCRALQNQYKVKDDFTTEDASHRPTAVYDDCAKFGWVAMFGDDELKGFDHLPKVGLAVRKLYSPIKKAMASDGTIVRYIRWAVTPVKDILFAKLAGRGPEMQVPDDIGGEWHDQIRGEVKKTMISPKTKKESERYVKIKRRNDACDVEGMLLTFALIKGVATPEIIETPEDTPEETEPTEETP